MGSYQNKCEVGRYYGEMLQLKRAKNGYINRFFLGRLEDKMMNDYILLLFGAGASGFCGDGVQPKHPALGCDLFSELNLNNEIVKKIPAKIQDILRQDFEQGVQKLVESKWRYFHVFLSNAACYFLQFSMPQIESTNNYYVRLIKLLDKTGIRFCCASLNYEMLLEEALLLCKQNIQVIKPHGSANFVPNLGKSVLNVEKWDGGIVDFPTKILSRIDAIKYFEEQPNGNAGSVPIMSLYSTNKQSLYNSVFIENERNEFHSYVKNARKILIIGVNINDNHIWQPLADTKAAIGFVNPARESCMEWKEQNNKNDVH